MSIPTPGPGPSLRGAVDLSALTRRAAAPPAGQPGQSASSVSGEVPWVVQTDDSGFQDVLELSANVPVIVEIVAPGVAPGMEAIVRSYGGKLALAIVDGTTSPQIAQAFQVREVPTIAAVVAGKPLALFVGIPSDPEVRQVLDQVLQLAAREGATGVLPPEGPTAPEDANAAAPEEPPLPPLHQEAYDAIEAGDFARAITAYTAAIKENPRDAFAVAGLAQVSLLARVADADSAAVRAAAASAPDDVSAALAVADLDLSGGHADDAFSRLLDVFVGADPDDRTLIRTRLLEYFEIVGTDDERVILARRRLTNLLY